MKSSVSTRSSLPFPELQVSNPSNNGYFPDELPNLIADEKRRLKEFRKAKAVQESQAGHRPSHHHYNHDHHIHKRRRSSTTVSRCTPSPTLVEDDSDSSQDESIFSYNHGDGILTMPPRSLQKPPQLSKTYTQQRDELQHILLAPQPMRVSRPRPTSRLTSSTHASAYMKEQQYSSSWGVHEFEHPFDLEHREEYSSDQQAVARNETWQNMHLHPLKMSRISSNLQHQTHIMNGHQAHSRFPSAMSRGSSGLAMRRIDPYSYANSNHRRIRLDVQGLSYIDEESESSAGHSTTSYEVGHVDPHEMRSYAPALVPPRPLRLPCRSAAPLPPPTTRRENNRVPRALPPRRRRISQQPSRHPGMQHKVLNPRNVKGMSYDEKGKRDWSTDLCRFCDHNLGTCEYFLYVLVCCRRR
ncbi:hypothetical protein D9613_008342 [Agrocybe pediades]|uniref:Uncharacterized protein n=1 Tax=Agrocybe pediades TaxID=84607 RepID=A0A8H4QSQ9_9AGAR|nr:hypothetical protein D9613_008342 [Agrocybe pediades]